MRFGILGPLDVRGPDDAEVSVGGPKVRALLALLLVNAGKVVSADRLVDGIYGARPPHGAANALQSQISRLRRSLPGLVEHRRNGYLLAVTEGDIDAGAFETLAARGEAALEAGDTAVAAATLRAALALWRGAVATEIPEPEAARLTELWCAAVEHRIAADLAEGELGGLVGELRKLVAEYPLREGFHAQLVTALRLEGRVAEALSAFESARRLLLDQLGTEPSPPLREAHLAALRADTGPGPEARLPRQLTRFVGREAELGELDAALSRHHLVTLTGPGGTGKTRLAIEAAQRRRGEVFLAELAAVPQHGSADEVASTVLDALGVREGILSTRRAGARQAPLDRLVNALTDRRLLLVLDNCEHVVASVATVAERVLAKCGSVTLLTTSREALGITGETLLPVPQLAVPPLAADADEARDYAAVALFVERATAVLPGFRLTGDNAWAVSRICEALDGLPLAIELAAARTRSLPVGELAARLDDRFALLSRGSRTAPERHRTLRGVVEWSWELLEERERELAMAMAVFVGGASLADLTPVGGIALPEGDASVPEVLAGLVDKSIVELTAEGRYRMLETIRAFALERLAETGTTDRLRRGHAERFLALAEQAAPYLRGGDQLEWLGRLDAELDNLQSALDWAREADQRLALRLVATLLPYWWLTGRRGEGAEHTARLLATLPRGGQEGLAEEYTMCVLSTSYGGSGGELANPGIAEHLAAVDEIADLIAAPPKYPFLLLLWGAANGIPRGAVTDSLLLRHDIVPLQAPWTIALRHLGRALVALYGGKVPVAETELAESLRGFRELGDRWGCSLALVELGRIAGWRGDHQRCVALMDEAIELTEQLAASEDLAEILCVKATALRHAGERDAAMTGYRRAAGIAERSGTMDVFALAHHGLAESARQRGDLREAERECELALARCPAGHFSFDGVRDQVRITQGRVAMARGHSRRAAESFHAVIRSAVARSDLPGAGGAVEALAGLVVAGHPRLAATMLGAATVLRGLAVAGDADVERVEAEARAALGRTVYRREHATGADMSHPAALELAETGVRAALDTDSTGFSAPGEDRR
ncbi:BTAD domain-containing putative transcriptional regulator [Saccharomonospora sp. NPDC006951]